eukprot:TRINITY_DN1249_c1_g1_i1.p2 TRINITY_DN1249_c1_g1~~TRINITY_DN1249_c1_g1_i1.p2  ORF type:complete len:143 (+),score=39.02 TRINITY_DN1249_c1_g1_i1:37-465(+)
MLRRSLLVLAERQGCVSLMISRKEAAMKVLLDEVETVECKANGAIIAEEARKTFADLQELYRRREDERMEATKEALHEIRLKNKELTKQMELEREASDATISDLNDRVSQLLAFAEQANRAMNQMDSITADVLKMVNVTKSG